MQRSGGLVASACGRWVGGGWIWGLGGCDRVGGDGGVWGLGELGIGAQRATALGRSRLLEDIPGKQRVNGVGFLAVAMRGRSENLRMLGTPLPCWCECISPHDTDRRNFAPG